MIRAMADPQSYNRGQNYQQGGAVSHCVRTATGLKARVAGNYNPYYKVTITLTDSDDLTGDCTCPVGYGCKHCVAVCLEWLAHPDSFAQAGPRKGGAHSQNPQDQNESQEIPKLTGIDVSTIASSWNVDDLRKNFLSLWTWVAPKAHGNCIPRNLPTITWSSTLDSIDDASGESGEKEAVGYAVDYSYEAIIADDPHPSFLQPNRNLSIVGRWFSPPELLDFFADPATKKILLAGWVDSYCDLGTRVRDAFAERGIIPQNGETFTEFYTEIFGDEWEREHEESGRSDYGWHRYDDYDDDEFDPDNVSIEELYPLANRFIKRVTPILRELAEYYCVLKQYGLSEEAQRFLASALAWFMSNQDSIPANQKTKNTTSKIRNNSDGEDLAEENSDQGGFDEDDEDNYEEQDDDDIENAGDDEGEYEDDENEIDIDKDSLQTLEPIRVEIRGLLESTDLQNVTPQEKVNYYLDLLARNRNPGNAELIRKGIGQSDDPCKLAEYAIQKLKPMFEEKPQEVLWTLIEEVIEEYCPSDIPALLELAVQHLRQYPDPHALLRSITSYLGSQSPPFIHKIQDALLNQLLPPLKKGKKQGHTSVYSDLYVQTVDWFVQYHQSKQNPQEVMDLLVQFAQNKPKRVEYGHYKVIKKIASGTNGEALQAFLFKVQGKGEPAEVALMLIDEHLLNPACETLARVIDTRTKWKIIQKLALKIKQKTLVSEESFQTLFFQLQSLIRQWINPDARSRPDHDIADAVEILKTLHKMHGTQDKWEKWYDKFFREHSRKHNLRAALKTKGLV